MPDSSLNHSVVINSSPLITIIAGTGDLSILKNIYREVVIPCEVCDEITVNNSSRFGADIFVSTEWLHKINTEISISPLLMNLLDKGEAAVIQTALDKNIKLVCIDDAAGRRIARLNGLEVTGTMGVLLRAKKMGLISNLRDVLDSMINSGFRISNDLYLKVINKSGEEIS